MQSATTHPAESPTLIDSSSSSWNWHGTADCSNSHSEHIFRWYHFGEDRRVPAGLLSGSQKGGRVMLKRFAVLLVCIGTAIGQSRTITISDSNGNQTSGTIDNGNVYFVDSSGNATFGTIRDGNVFLTDSKGITTGTIRNGNIFLNNSDGGITTGSYTRTSSTTSTTTTTTASPVTSSATVQEQSNPQAQQSANYQAGYVVGQQLGTALGGAINRHRVRSFCKKHPYGSWRFPNGTVLGCAQINARM